MAKRFSPEFKQQAIDYALSNSHEPIAAIAQKLGVGYSTLDKWIREANPEPYRVCRRVNILRDYPDDKTKLYPRN